MTRTLMFVKAAATIVAEKITIHSGIRLSTATNPEYRRVRDGDGCERRRKAFVTRTAYPQNRGTGGTGTRGALFSASGRSPIEASRRLRQAQRVAPS